MKPRYHGSSTAGELWTAWSSPMWPLLLVTADMSAVCGAGGRLCGAEEEEGGRTYERRR